MFFSKFIMPVRPERLSTPSPVKSDYSSYYDEELPSSYLLNSGLDCSFLNDTELMSHVFGNVNFDFPLPSIDNLLEASTEVKTNCLWSDGANAMLSTFPSSSNAMATSSSATTTAAATMTTTATTTTNTTSPRRPLQSFSSTMLDANYGGSSSSSNVLSEYCNYLAFTGGSSSSSSSSITGSSLMSSRNSNDRLRLSISSTTSTGSLGDPFSHCRRLHRESISALSYFDNDFSENDNNNFVIWTDNSSENSSLKDPDHSEGTIPTSSSCSPNSCDSYKVISKNQTSNNEFKVSEDHTYFSKKDETESISSLGPAGAAVTDAAVVTRASELLLLSSAQISIDKMVNVEDRFKSTSSWGQENKSLYGNQKLRHTEAHDRDIVTSIDDSETDDWFDFGAVSNFLSSSNSRSNSCSSSCSGSDSVYSTGKRQKKEENSKSPQKNAPALVSNTDSLPLSPKSKVTKAKYRSRKSASANRSKNSQQRASKAKRTGRPSKTKLTSRKKAAELAKTAPLSATTVSSSFLSAGLSTSLRTTTATTSPKRNPSVLLSSPPNQTSPTFFFESEKCANTIPDLSDPNSSDGVKVVSMAAAAAAAANIHVLPKSSSQIAIHASGVAPSSNEDPISPKADLNLSNQTLIKTSIKRALHNNLEKQRRDALRIAFENLRNAVPKLIGNSKAAKIQILSESRHYCKELIKRQSSVVEEKQYLINKQKILIKQLCDSLF